jgi:hypothetical protein
MGLEIDKIVLLSSCCIHPVMLNMITSVSEPKSGLMMSGLPDVVLPLPPAAGRALGRLPDHPPPQGRSRQAGPQRKVGLQSR